MYKKILFVYLLIFIFVFVYACTTAPKIPPKPPTLDANQLRSLQVKEIDGDFDACFKACIFILQDEGWIIREVDKPSGLIQAKSLSNKETVKGRGWYQTWKEANATLEPWGKGITKVRLSLVKIMFSPTSSYTKGLILSTQVIVPEQTKTEIIDDPTVYQHFFARLKKEVFRRQNLNK